MAIIYSYPIATPTDSDLLIISRTPEDPDEISNFSVSMSSVADFVIDRFIDPDATDFQIPVFNQGGTKITGSIMSQDSSPSNGVAGTRITITGNVSIDNEITANRGGIESNFSIGDDLTVNGEIDTGTLLVNGTSVMNDELDMQFSNIRNVLDPTLAQDAATKAYVDAGNTGQVTGTGTANYVAKWSDADTITDSLLYDSGISVGIGTSLPTSKLQVVGEIDSASGDGYKIEGRPWARFDTGLLTLGDWDGEGYATRIMDSDSSEAIRIINNGNVGIGTTNPEQKLHVTGNTKVDGVIVLNSANNSVYIGSSNTGKNSTSTGDRNVAIGKDAFRSNTTARYNTTVGHSSMQSTTEGGFNSVLGNQALKLNIDGSYNVAVGNQSIAFATNSDDNTGVGYRALYQAQSSNNTGIGKEALVALQSSTNSGNNTAIGVRALRRMQSGANNVAIGKDAGENYGGGNNSLLNANESIFIGVDSYAAGDNQTNQIVIGYDAVGLGSNTVVLGNNNIVTTQLKGNVGIGTTSPQQKLDVNGNIAVKNATQISFDSNTGDLSIGGDAGRMNLLSNSLAIDYSGNVGIGTTSPASKLDVNGGIRMADDSSTASASNVGTLRYRTSGNNSYVDMCMQTGATTYAWVNIVQNNW